MNCNKCNSVVPEGTKFCPTCGNQLLNEQVNMHPGISNVYQQNVQSNMQNNMSSFNNQMVYPQPNAVSTNSVNVADKANVWLAILSWFIPLAGLIIFFVKKKTSPKTAKVSGICALISFCLSMLVVFSFVAITVTTINNIKDRAEEQINEINDHYDNDYEIEDDKSDVKPIVDDVEVSSDWQKYEFAINGTKYTLPLAYSEFSKEVDFELKSEDKNLTIKPDYYRLVNLYKNDNFALTIEIVNNTESEIVLTEGMITRIVQTKYNVENGEEVIIFPGNIYAGMKITEERIIELFGNPDDTNDYHADNYDSKTYKYLSDNTWSTVNNLEIRVVNGVIDEVKLDHRD